MFPDHINWSLLFCSILNSFSSYLQCAIVINKIGQNLLLALEMKLIYPLNLDLEWTHVISLRIFLTIFLTCLASALWRWYFVQFSCTANSSHTKMLAVNQAALSQFIFPVSDTLHFIMSLLGIFSWLFHWSDNTLTSRAAIKRPFLTGRSIIWWFEGMKSVDLGEVRVPLSCFTCINQDFSPSYPSLVPPCLHMLYMSWF